MVAFDLASDSTGTTVQSYRVFAYDDLACTPSRHGEKLGQFALGGAREKIGPQKVAAGSPLVFAVQYVEARHAQNRGCTFTAAFTPEAGRSYEVTYLASNQGLACGLQITNERKQPVTFDVPEFTCAAPTPLKARNGGAGVINWKITVWPAY